jgi:hypothetical protein
METQSKESREKNCPQSTLRRRRLAGKGSRAGGREHEGRQQEPPRRAAVLLGAHDMTRIAGHLQLQDLEYSHRIRPRKVETTARRLKALRGGRGLGLGRR